ncbi:H+transporting two-sector ATPase B/B' subunit [Ancylobacter novellus DSM 506]|uniref:ATP synthase subunit b n=1 Tax=Ancylobacter novellus (strain ATCC 8093 / DSM 506 / JCM 20403 / CCM 1077 / IAM 12100 / NBRC 12443 / NCIMB 10456) TaxID=639283 RepID=D7A3R2_ANCN5|nr:F0F1 ATP synthase subunit B [Ancylobacter novellus]ADH91689.1 H+transporting two-sector ATPase B/B' subunit [Ancylobacter novellus DSM 506]
MPETQGPAGTFVIAQAEPAVHGAAPAHEGVEIAVPPAEAHGGGFPPFDVHTFPSQLIWLAIAFGALYLLMSRIALPRIANILEERHDRIADDLEEAGKLKAESEAAAYAYEQALASARNKAHGIATETRDKLAADSEAGRKSLEAELSAKLAAAETQIAATKDAAMSNVRGIAVDAAGAIVGNLIGTAPAPQAVEAAVDTAIKG